jgi:hypothetical protein
MGIPREELCSQLTDPRHEQAALDRVNDPDRTQIEVAPSRERVNESIFAALEKDERLGKLLNDYTRQKMAEGLGISKWVREFLAARLPEDATLAPPASGLESGKQP